MPERLVGKLISKQNFKFQFLTKILGWDLKLVLMSGCTVLMVNKQEGAELCQDQPAKHNVFGSNGAIFWFELLIVLLLNC